MADNAFYNALQQNAQAEAVNYTASNSVATSRPANPFLDVNSPTSYQNQKKINEQKSNGTWKPNQNKSNKKEKSYLQQAQERLDTAQQNLGYVTDPVSEAAARKEYNEAKAALDQAKAEGNQQKTSAEVEAAGGRYTPNYGTAGGNIDLNARPTVANPNFTYSTVDSVSIGVDGKTVLIPTVINEDGKWKHVSVDEAIDHYFKTGEQLGIFDTPEEAGKYGIALHNDQANQYDASAPQFLGQKDNLPDISNISQLSLQQGPQKVGEQELVPGRANQLGYRAKNVATGIGRTYAADMENLVGTGIRFMGETSAGANPAVLRAQGKNTEQIKATLEEASKQNRGQSMVDYGTRVKESSDRRAAAGQSDIEQAKSGLHPLAQFGIDLAVNTGQKALDVAAATLTGGAALVPLGLRVAGGSARKARMEGATTGEQLAYGAVRGGIEAATEGMFDGFAGAYGKGNADEMVEAIIGKMTQSSQNPVVRTALRTLFSGIGEALEEGASNVSDPLTQMIYKGFSAIPKGFNKEWAADTGYGMLVGFAMGLIGGGGKVITGADAQANTALANVDQIQANLVSNGMNVKNSYRAATILSQVAEGKTISVRDAEFLRNLGQNINTQVESSNPLVQNNAPTQQAEASTPVTEEPTTNPQWDGKSYKGYTIDGWNGGYDGDTIYDVYSPDGRKIGTYDGLLPYDGSLPNRIAEMIDNDIAENGQATAAPQVQNTSIDDLIAQAEEELLQAQQAYDAAQNDPEMQAPLLEAVEQAQERLDNLRNQKASAEQLTNSETSSTETTQAPTENEAPQENSFPQQTNAERIAELEQMLQNETDPMRRGMLQAEIDRLQKENTFNTGDNSGSGNNPSNGETWSGPEVQTQSTVHDQLTEEEKARDELNPENDTHVQHHDSEVDNYAQNRITERGHEGAREDLMSRDPAEWDDVDVRTAQMLLSEELENARKLTGEEQDAAYRRIAELKNAYNKQGTEAGRTLRQRQRFGGTMEDIISEAATILYGEENQRNLKKMKPEQKSELMKTIEDYAQKRENRQAGDTASLIEMIKELNEKRRTAGLFNKKTSAPMSFFLEQAANQDGGEEFLNNILGQQIRGLANDQVKTSAKDVINTIRFNNMLSNLATVVRNFVANPVMDLSEAISTDLGVLFDVAMSKFTGTRSIAWDSRWFSAAKRAGTADAFVRSVIEEGLDAPLESSGKYEEVRQGRTFKMSGGFLERVFSTWSKYLNYGLKTTDEMMKGGIRESTQAGLDRLYDRGRISEKGHSELENRADYVAKERTLQKDDGAAGELAKAKQSKGPLGALLRQIMPFAQVPANATAMSINYTPAGILSTLYEVGKAINTVKNGGTVTADQQAKIVTSLGRNVNATALMGLSFVLAMKGIIRTAEDDDKDKAALEKAEGLNGTQLNLSALGRWISGEDTESQEGDQLLGLGFLEYLNASMAMGAALAEDYKDNGKITFKDVTMDNIGAVYDSVMSLPAISQISSFSDSIRYSDADTIGGKLADTSVALGGSIASGYFVPNWLRGIAKGADQYERVTTTGDTMQNNINYLVSGIPVLREQLPVKVDPLGNDVKRGNNPLVNFLNATVMPGELRTYTPHEVTSELNRLSEATGSSVFPDRNAPNTITFDDEKYELTTEDKTEYLKTAGAKTDQYLQQLYQSDLYRGLSDAGKAKATKEMESLAEDAAKEEFINGKGKTYSSDRSDLISGVYKPGDAYDKTGLAESNIVTYSTFKIAFNEAVKKEDYKTIDNLVSRYNRLNDNTRTVLSERNNVLRAMVTWKEAGFDSRTYSTVQKALVDSQVKLDKSQKTGSVVELDALANVNLPEATKRRLIDSLPDYGSKTVKGVYDILYNYGFDSKQINEFWNTSQDWVYKDTGDTQSSQKAGTLQPLEAYYAIEQLPGLDDTQKTDIYNQMKEVANVPYKINDWGNYTFGSERSYYQSGRSRQQFGGSGISNGGNYLFNALQDTQQNQQSQGQAVNAFWDYLRK